MASPLDFLGAGAHALGQGVGAVVGLPFQFLGGMLGQSPGNQGGWKHPDRQALAMSYIPEALREADRAQRMETFRLVPINNWPMLIRQFQKTDLDAAKIHASPEAQELYDMGGPQLWQQRYPGVPLPTARPITVKDYPPLDALDQAIADAGKVDRVPLPFPIQAQGAPMFPPPAPKDAVEFATSKRQLGAMSRPGAEGEYAADIIAKVPPSIAKNQEVLGKLAPILEQGIAQGFVPEVKMAPDGYSIDFKNPQATAFQSGMGSKRSEVTRLGGGGAPAGAPRKPGGNQGIETPGGKWFDMGNGQFIDPDGMVHDSPPPAGTTVVPGEAVLEGSPAAEPMRGQPSLSVENYPDATAADFKQMADELDAKRRQRLELETKRMEADIAARTLSSDDRAALRKMIPAKAMLSILEQYAEGGKDGVPSTLPKARVRGGARVLENLRQGQTYQEWWDADPFLQGFRRLQTMGRPILARGIGDEQGNLNQNEQSVWDSVLQARSVPEVRDAVEQVRGLVKAKEELITAGKSGAPGTAGPKTRTLSSGKTLIIED